jgi:hypothetical protein
LESTGPDTQDEVAQLELRQPFAVVGRQVGADLVFDHWQLSRKHAYFQILGGRLFCVDLRSRLGVQWESGSAPAGWVNHGESVQIGGVRIRHLQEDGPGLPFPTDPLEHAETGDSSIAPARLERERSNGPSTSWTLDRPLTLVGRADECRVRLSDEALSKFECSLVRTVEGIWAVDLLGRGALAINGRTVRWAWLDDGDLLEIGSTQLRLRYEVRPTVLTREDVPLEAGADREVYVKKDTRTRAVTTLTLLKPEPCSELQAAIPASAELSLLQPILEQVSRMQLQMYDEFFQSMMMMAKMFAGIHREQSSSFQSELEEIRRLTKELTELQARLGPTSASLESGPNGSPNTPVQDGAHGAASGSPVSLNFPETPLAPNIHSILNARIAELRGERQGRWQRLLESLSRLG